MRAISLGPGPGALLLPHPTDVPSELFQLLLRPEQVAECLQRLSAVLEPRLLRPLELLVQFPAVFGSQLKVPLAQLHRHPSSPGGLWHPRRLRSTANRESVDKP